MGGACSTNGKKRNAYRILVGKPTAKRPLGRPRSRWEDNIGMDLREIGWGGMDWIDVAQDMDQWMVVVNTVMNVRVPENVGKFLSGCATGGFSRRAQLHVVIQVVEERSYTRVTKPTASTVFRYRRYDLNCTYFSY
jgi:hypothetical protein